MKRFLVISFLLISLISKADAWDNLTHSQAKFVVHFLKKNPFIIDWCDCCGNEEPAYLIRVDSAAIVPCSWDKKQYSVISYGERICRFQNAHVGLDDYHTDSVQEKVEYTIYMNYTFAFDQYMKWAVPFHKLMDYGQDGPICFGATNYPNPKDEGVKITDTAYQRWYAQHIAKH